MGRRQLVIRENYTSTTTTYTEGTSGANSSTGGDNSNDSYAGPLVMTRHGGMGQDLFDRWDGTDSIDGGAGSDVLVAGWGGDTIVGGLGRIRSTRATGMTSSGPRVEISSTTAALNRRCQPVGRPAETSVRAQFLHRSWAQPLPCSARGTPRLMVC